MEITVNANPADGQAVSAGQYRKHALWLLGIRGSGLGRVVRLVSFLLVTWSLLAWGAALALITRAEIPNADVIVVLSNASAYQERTRHAAQLWKMGRAPRVLLTNENLRSSWSEAEQRNPLFTERATEALKSAGVPRDKIEVLPEMVGGTVDEAVLMSQYARKHGLRSILIVTSAYHSRRALWTFRNAFRDSGIAIGLDPVATGFQTPTPATWWLHPSAWKIVALEYPKFLYYRIKYRSTSAESLATASEPGPEVKVVTGLSQSGLTLSVAAPVSAYTDEVVLIDARKSVGVPKRPQSNGTPSVTIDFGDGYNCNLLASGHAFRKAGTYTITVTAKNASGSPAAPVSTTIQISDIPTATGINTNNGPGQNVIDMTDARGASYYIPETGYRNATANAVKLQAAIKRAAANNRTAEQEIVLPAGAVFAGPITLPTSVGSKYITIRGGSLSSLPAGSRVGPGQGRLMPTITAPSSKDMTLPALQTPSTAPTSPPHHYRLQGLHIKKDDELSFAQVLVALGAQYGLDAVSKISHHFIVDRCWVDGGTQDKAYGKDGMRITSDYVSVVDSYFSEFKILSGPDATAISVTVGQGPYAFWNNTMVAGAENFFFGGGSIISSGIVSNPTTSSATLSSVANLELDQNIAFKVGGVYSVAQSTIVRSISGNNITFDPIATAPDSGSVAEWITTPSYIEFRRNYLFKPLKWFPRHPSWNGTTYQIKNLWEAKIGRYILNDGNVFENSWMAGQSYALQISPRNVTAGQSPAAVLRDMQWTNNIVRNVAAGVRITASDYEPGYPSQLLTDVTFRNNLFWNVGRTWDAEGSQHQFLGLSNPYNVQMKRIFVIHNTTDYGPLSNSYTGITMLGTEAGESGALEAIWVNNVHQDGGYGFFSSISSSSAANITTFFPGSNSTTFAKNYIANTNGHAYPAWFITEDGITWSSKFVDYSNGNFTLVTGHPGKGRATDGTDVGVDMTALNAATIGTVSGVWTPVQPTRPRRVSK